MECLLYASIPFLSPTATASDTTGTPGGPSDAIVIGIPTIVFGFLGVLILAGVAIWAAWYQGKKKKNETLNNQSKLFTQYVNTCSLGPCMNCKQPFQVILLVHLEDPVMPLLLGFQQF